MTSYLTEPTQVRNLALQQNVLHPVSVLSYHGPNIVSFLGVKLHMSFVETSECLANTI